MKILFKVVGITVIAFVFSTCRMSYSFSGADIPAEAKTFSVDYFSSSSALVNPTFNQNFTESLKDLLLAQTPLDIVKQNGDVRFSGRITKYETMPVSAQGNQTAAQDRFTIEVEVSYFNKYEPEKNFERTFSRFLDYNSNQSFASVEESLAEDISTQLIQEIFNASVGSW